MSLASLVGHWQDEQGSTYDVSLDAHSASRLPRCSVKITRPGGHVKDAKGVIKATPDGFLSWNNKYVIDTDSMTKTFVKWTSLLGNRGFVWTRAEENQKSVQVHCSHLTDQASSVPNAKTKPSPHWLPKSGQSQGLESSATAPEQVDMQERCLVSSTSGMKSLLERVVGSWWDDSGTTYQTELDSNVNGAESCTVTITRTDKQPLVVPGAIILKSDGSVSWSDRYVLDLNSGALIARWLAKTGKKSFVWYRKALAAEEMDFAKTVDMVDRLKVNPTIAVEGGSIPKANIVDPSNEDSLYDANSMAMLSGRWCDRNGWSYDVIPDVPAKVGEGSCTVRVRKACRVWNVYPGLIHVTPQGRIAWSDSHFLCGFSSSQTFVTWRCVQEEVSFVWFRPDARVPATLPDKVSGDTHWSVGETVVTQGHRNIAPHFCIFENMSQGIKSWSGQGGVHDDRWSAILLSLLQCVMMDGIWLQEVTASAFVGPDAIHISGAIQQLATPQVWRDGKAKTCPATPGAWEDLLWQHQAKNSAGLHWEIAGPACSISDSTLRMLSRVNAMLDRSSPDAVALVFDYRHADVTYDDLRLSGMGKGSSAQDVFILLGSGHGFGAERKGQNSLVDRIISCFKARLGSDRVVRVNLRTVTTSEVSIPMPKVASFLSTEFSRGSLANVVAGLERRRGEWWQ